MPAVVEYLQVAVSSVVSEIVVEAVPAERVPEGAPLARTGGVVSEAVLFTVMLTAVDVAVLEEASLATAERL